MPMAEVSKRLFPLFCLLKESSRLPSGIASEWLTIEKLEAVWLWTYYLEVASFLRCAFDISYLIIIIDIILFELKHRSDPLMYPDRDNQED